LKFLEGLVDDDGINAMAEGDNTPTHEEYGDMLVDQFPNQDEEAMDKYLNMELTMAIGMDNERWGGVVTCLRGIGGEPIGHAHSNPFFDMREYDVVWTGQQKNMPQMSLLITCMHRLVMKVICFNSCWKSWIIRRMEWRLISWMVELLQQMEM
jgi:hypothetical protein